MKVQTTTVLPCTCSHEFQDKMYGKGLRLMNIQKQDKHKACCTVCGTLVAL